MTHPTFILTLSCDDTVGIVSAVSTFLADHGGFIIESAQFGDPSTNRFFMRTKFKAGDKAPDYDSLTKIFTPIAKKFNMTWELQDVDTKARVMIMVSKASHCLNDLLHRKATEQLPIDIPAIVSNHETLKPLADFHGIPFHHLPIDKSNKKEQEAKIYKLFEDLECDAMILARYMQILTPELSHKLEGRAINIHHSFLPSFKGAKPYHQAYDRGVKIIGATAHYVTSDLDEGPIIEQEVTRVDHTYSPKQLVSVGQDIECLVLARALAYHIERRVILNGRKTVIFK